MYSSLPQRLASFIGKPVIRRSLLGVVAFFLLFSLFGYLIVPVIIKSQAEKLISDKLHRQASIGKVEVHPYALAVTLRDFKMLEPQGGAIFASFDAFTIDLSSESIWRLAPVVQEARLTKPYLHLVRSDAQRYNIDDLIALAASQPPSEQQARFSFNNIQVQDGRIEFVDTPAGTTHTIAELQLGVPFISSLPSQVDIFVEPLLNAKVNGAPLLIKGKARPFANPREAVVELNLDDIDVVRFLKYLPIQPRLKLSGARLALQLQASFQQSKDQRPALKLSGGASLKSAQLAGPDGKPVLKLPELALTLGENDVLGGRFELTRVNINGLEADWRDDTLDLLGLAPAAAPAKPAAKSAAFPFHFTLGELQVRNARLSYASGKSSRPLQAEVEKLDLVMRKLSLDSSKKTVTIADIASGSGHLSLRQGKPQAPAADTAPGHAPKPAAGESAPYRVSLARLDLANWSARFEDQSQPEPVATVASPLRLSLQNLGNATTTPARMEFEAAFNQGGRLAASGKLGLTPLSADLALDLKGVDMLPLQPYISDRVNLRLTRASLAGKGRLQLAQDANGQIGGGFNGDLALDNLATVDKTSANDFVRWKALAFNGMNLRLQPLAISAEQVTLNEFFARIIIDPNGRINFQDIARSHPAEQKSLTSAAERSAAASRTPAAGEDGAQAGGKSKAELPPIVIKKLVLQGGRVRFTDNFIKPNYTANLMNFGGVVSGLSTRSSTPATIDLHGEVNRAPLAVAGRINPRKDNLFLDIKARVKGMELAALSPYSSRYVGYGIEKGKLSFDVSYLVENGKFTAQNRLILDQLTFGEKVDSPSALKLPVRLAVALLRDRNGVIDINVPVGGSLNDPQFSIGGVLLKMIGNAIAKAVTQPFALLGSLFGGGSSGELAMLEFEPGRATIPEAGANKLSALAKALAERPALQLEITGRSDPEADRAGLKRAAIDRKLRVLKAKDLGQGVDARNIVVKPEEYPALLARAYREEKFAKPRNMLGLQKNLPVAEMERLMLDNAQVNDDDLLALANRRAQAVKDWLVNTGQASGDRIFILASKEGSDEGEASGRPGSRVDFSLR